MTTFDAREKEFEARFKHDQELQFKITARRNRLLGLWAAQHLGLLGDSAEAYAEEVRAYQAEAAWVSQIPRKAELIAQRRVGYGDEIRDQFIARRSRD